MDKIKVSAIYKEDLAPHYASEQAAGADLRADIKDDIVINPGDFTMVPTGIYLQLPSGYEAQVRPRSGLAARNGVTVLNSPGTIDSDYRGEVKVILINHGSELFRISRGDRIAQIIISPVLQAEFVKVDLINDTDRGSGGFGSTGIS